MGKMLIVRNLATLETREYSCSPREAVIAAYAAARGDWNTWDYELHYGSRVRESELCYSIGDWATFKDGRETA